MDNVLHSIQLSIKGIGLVAGNLRGPVGVRLVVDAGGRDTLTTPSAINPLSSPMILVGMCIRGLHN